MFNTHLTLVDAVNTLTPILGADEARVEVDRAFRSKQLRTAPGFAVDYSSAEIDWTTGIVTLSRLKRSFTPMIDRDDFNKVFQLVQPPTTADLLTNLFDQYDEITGDVSRATLNFFEGQLKRWFGFLDQTAPFARPILTQLEASSDFDNWFIPYRNVGLAAPRGGLSWPENRRKRLGLQILLMRKMAQGEIDAKTFGAMTLGARSASVGISVIIEQIFGPLSRELRRFLKEQAGQPGAMDGVIDLGIPASDRIVRLDHNSADYAEVIAGLDKLEDGLRGLNDFIDDEEREQRLAEIRAGKSLLQSAKARVEPLTAVIGTMLRWAITEFAKKELGTIADATWKALTRLIG